MSWRPTQDGERKSLLTELELEEGRTKNTLRGNNQIGQSTQQSKSTRLLGKTKRVIDDTIETGKTVAELVASQGEVLNKVESNLKAADVATDQAATILAKLERRTCMRKALIPCLLTFFTVFFLVVLWLFHKISSVSQEATTSSTPPAGEGDG